MVLRILLNLNSDASQKRVRVFKTLVKKSFIFVLKGWGGNIIFNLSFVLLLIEIDLIIEKQGYKRDTLVAYDSSCIEIVFVLVVEKIALYKNTSII